MKAVASYRIESNNLYTFQVLFANKTFMKQFEKEWKFNSKKLMM
jgi:hypothetical protein